MRTDFLFFQPLFGCAIYLRDAIQALVHRFFLWQKGGADPVNVLCLCFFLGVCWPLMQSELWAINTLLFLLLLNIVLTLRYQCLQYSAALFFGLLWASMAFQQHINHAFPTEFERVNIVVEGQLVNLPVSQEGNVRFQFLVQRSSDVPMLVGHKLQLSCYRCALMLLPDQQWRFTVRLKRPHGYASWGAFDYEKYLFRQKIVATGYIRLKGALKPSLKNEGIWLEQPRQESDIRSVSWSINQWRWQIKQQIGNLSASNSVGLAIITALSIGDKSGFTQQQRQVFQNTGVSHLMAISGLHIGLVFIFISSLLRYLLFPFARVYEIVSRPSLVLLPAWSGALLYSLLAGLAASTQRAMIMLSLFVLCRLFARDVSLFKVLLVAACIIVLCDPFSILDVGFWLSFGAVLVIAVISARQQVLSLLRLQPQLWLGMTPMTSFFFGQISLISPFVNLVMVPLFCLLLIPLTLLAVFALNLGFVDLASPLLLGLNKGFIWLYQCLAWLADLPLAHWFSAQWSVLHSAILLLFLLLYLFRHRATLYCAFVFLICILFNPAGYFNNDVLRVALLDVGQGLSMVIERGDYVLVYDTGPRYASGFTAAKAVLLPYLRQRGIRKIDQLIISHADNDHIGGYETLINSINVARVMTSRVDVLTTASECQTGQQWSVDEVVFTMLSPTIETPLGSNNRSCVLRLDYAGTRVLITGDIEKQVERYLLQQPVDLAADIMLVPHQGSKTSSTESFLDRVKPTLAIVAAGHLNLYGHPHKRVVQRYVDRHIDFVSTASNGSIVLEIDGSGWFRTSFRDAERRFWHHQKKPNWD